MRKETGRTKDFDTLRQEAEKFLPQVPLDTQKYFQENFYKLLEDLHLYQIELEIQNEQLRQSQLKLEDSRARYFDLYHCAPASYFSIDRQGKIVEANMAAANLLGTDRRNLLKSKISDFIPWNLKPVFRNYCGKVFDGSEKQACELALNKHDGSMVYVQLQASVEEINGSPADQLKMAAIDISSRKRAQELLLLSYNLLQTINRHSQLDPLLQYIVSEIKKCTSCSALGIRLLDEDGNIPYRFYDGFSNDFYESENHLSLKTDKCMCIKVIMGDIDKKLPFFTAGGSFYTNSTTRLLAEIPESLRQTCNVYHQSGYESVALVPIRLGKRIIGLIHLADCRENMLPFDLVEVLEKISMPLGSAICRVQTEETLYRLNLKLNLKKQISDIFLTTSEKEMYAKVLRTVLETMDSKSGFYGYVNYRGDLVCSFITQEVGSRDYFAREEIVFPHSTWAGIWEEVFVQKKVICSNLPFVIPFGPFPVEKALVAPIIYGNKLIGAITVADKAGDYDQEDLALLETVAVHIAPVLNVRLHKAREEALRKEVENKIKLLAKFPSEDPNPVLRVRQDGLITFCNESGELILNFWKTKTGGFIPQEWKETVQNTYTSQQKTNMEIRHENRFFSMTVTPIPKTGYVNIYGEDITERKRAELELAAYRDHLEKMVSERTFELKKNNQLLIQEITRREQSEKNLRHSNSLLSSVVESPSQVIIVSLDREYNFTFFNSANAREMKKVWGVDVKLGKNFLDCIPSGEQRAKVLKNLERVLKGERFIIEEKYGLPGNTYWYKLAFNPILNGKEVTGITMFFTNITQRKQAEEVLRKSEKQLREAQQIARLGSWELDLLQNKLSWSDEIYRIFGVSPQEFGASYEAFLDTVHPDDREFVNKAYINSVNNKTRYDIVHRLLLRDGTVKHVNEKCVTEYDENGKALRSIGTAQDITMHVQIETALKKALNEVEELKDRLYAENIYLQDEIKSEYNFTEIIGQDSELNKILKQIERVALTDSTVLILGETGTGKELIARAIHDISPRNDRPLVKLNCAAIPETLIESELFGHEKGAFTGALSQKIGRFELADRGTIFLDEIGDLPLGLQSKLLRILQEGEFERLGNPKTIKVNVRVIAATNHDLEKAMVKGTFRKDLYYRLDVFPLKMPPLRERKSDIPFLVNHFVKKYNAKIGKNIESVPAQTMNALKEYSWPGNVREMENVIERAVILSDGPTLKLDEVFFSHPGIARGQVVKPLTLKENERAVILKALEKSNWVIEGKSGAAKQLDILPGTLRYRMKILGIKRPPRQLNPK